MTERIEIEALLWAWTNVTGRMPDRNTMTEDEIQDYWDQYGEKVRAAIIALTGMAPDEYLQSRQRANQ